MLTVFYYKNNMNKILVNVISETTQPLLMSISYKGTCSYLNTILSYASIVLTNISAVMFSITT